MLDILAVFFGNVMNCIYNIINSYGLSIIIFSILAKIILFPLSIIVQKNSIKMVKMKPQIDELKLKNYGDKDAFMEAQIELFEKEKYHPSLGIIPLLIQIPIILGLVYVIKDPYKYIDGLNTMNFCGINLAKNPSNIDYFIIPILAMISTIILWLIENKVNVLQKEQNFANKLFTGIITIGITVYFVYLVPNGVGMYWICGDIFAIIQLFILNSIFPPKKYVDYDYLEKIKRQKNEKIIFEKESKKKSKYYYKKFFEEENIENMELVFYAEKGAYYKYFKRTIEYILKNSDIKIHYITSDMNDKIFEFNNSKLIPYYIATKELIPLFMKMEADIVIMTTPDLQNLYLKRSIVRKDVKYIYTMHGIGSPNLTLKTGALDYFDIIFAVGSFVVKDIRQIESLRKTKKKQIVECGYPLLDDMIDSYSGENQNEPKTILIAPSWQKDNIIDSCIEDILSNTLNKKYNIILRPHPQYIKHFADKIEYLSTKFNEKENENFKIERDFSSNETVYNADLLITDWSNIAFEYSFSTLKPVLFVNTPMKVMNDDYQEIENIPIDIYLRDKIGKSIDIEKIDCINDIIEELLYTKDISQKICEIRNENIFNIGNSAQVAGKFIIDEITKSREKIH